MTLAERIADSLITFVDAYYWPQGEKQLAEFIQERIDEHEKENPQ